MQRQAVFSDCGKFRYLHITEWDASKPKLVFGLLNPSTASAEAEDPTSNKTNGFAERLGYGGRVIFNAYAYKATDPKDLKRAGYPVGPENDRYILEAAAMGDGIVICGWGSNARGLSRPTAVLKLLRENGYKPMALRLSPDGTPWHPLYLPYTCTPMACP